MTRPKTLVSIAGVPWPQDGRKFNRLLRFQTSGHGGILSVDEIETPFEAVEPAIESQFRP
jgi:hypothetical protein